MARSPRRNAGRKKKPTALKKLQGTARKDRENDREPVVEALRPGEYPAPDYLNPNAARIWRETVRELTGMGVIGSVDLESLAIYCLAVETVHRTTRVIDREGDMVITKMGSKAHPLLAVRREAINAVRAFAAEFGLTPASRARVKTVKADKEKDAFEEFLSEGANEPTGTSESTDVPSPPDGTVIQ